MARGVVPNGSWHPRICVAEEFDHILQGLRLFDWFDRKFFDSACNILEVSVSFDWVDKLCACESSKKESRLIFTLVGIKLSQRVLLRLDLAQKLLEAFYLPLEFAAHLSRFRRCILRISRSKLIVQPCMDHLAFVD